MPDEATTGTGQQGGTGTTQTDDKGSNGGGTSDRTFTQDDVNRIVQDRLAKERDKIGDVDELRRKATEFDKLEEASKTDLQRAQSELEEAKATASTSTAAALRLEVALEKAPAGMEPAKIAKLAKRLAGSNREDLEKDAEELFADFTPDGKRPSGQRPTPDLQQVPLGGDAGDVKTDMNDWMRRKAVSE